MESNRFPIQVYFLRQELLRRGYSVHFFPQTNLLLVEKGGKEFFCSATKTQVQNQLSFFMSENKFLTKRVLEHYGIPVAKGKKITIEDIARIRNLEYPLVLKPLSLNGGKGVVVGIKSESEVYQYFKEHTQYSQILAEEMLVGDDARILIVRGKFFAAVRRIPAFVVGDGVSTIEELVVRENQRRQDLFKADEANQTYTTGLCLILFDTQAQRVISQQGFTKDSVINRGERLFVRNNNNVSTGGISIDCTDDICPEIRAQCEEVARRLTMTFAGIDIMTTDFSRPLSLSEKSGIVEVNASPGIELHILVDEGVSRDPTPAMVDEIEEYLF